MTDVTTQPNKDNAPPTLSEDKKVSVKAGRPDPVFLPNPPLSVIIGGRVLGLLTRLLFRVYGQGRVIGLENIPRTGGVILAANHASNLDPFLGWAITNRRRKMWGVAKVELWEHPVSRFAMQCVGAIPVRRGTADRTMIRAVLERLAKGEAVGIFPEGTRTTNGQLQAAQAGIGLLVQRSGVPVVPVAIIGTYAMLPPGQKRLKRARLTMIYGKPLTFGPYETREAIAAQVMAAIAQLIKESG
jgi:1-acyl-sn-glycerol-3-phosphate acyltransferase